MRLSSKVAGRLASLAVKEGDRSPPARRSRASTPPTCGSPCSAARAERAQADAERRLRLAGSRAEDIAEAEAQVERAQAELARRAGGPRAHGEAARQRLRHRQVARRRAHAPGHGRGQRWRRPASALRKLRAGSRAEEMDAAAARVAAADARIAQLEQQIADAVVKSPLDGVVTEKLAETGELVTARRGPGRGHRAAAALAHRLPAGARPRPHPPGPGGGGRHRRRPEAHGPRDVRRRRRPSSRPRTSRRRTSARSSSTRSRSASTTRTALFKPGMPAEARLRRRTGGGEVTRRGERRRRRGGGAGAPLRDAWSPWTASPSRCARGEMFGLIGPDGAGKTTTLRMVLGLLPAHGGKVAHLRPRPCGASAAKLSGRDRLPVAALLALRRPHRGREHRVLRRDPRRAAAGRPGATSCWRWCA